MNIKTLLYFNGKIKINWNEPKIHQVIDDIQKKLNIKKYSFDYTGYTPWSEELADELCLLKNTKNIKLDKHNYTTAQLDLDGIKNSLDCDADKKLTDVEKKQLDLFSKSFINEVEKEK